MTYGFKMANSVTDLRVTGKTIYKGNSQVLHLNLLPFKIIVSISRHAKRCGG